MEHELEGIRLLVENRAVNYALFMKIFMDEPDQALLEALKEGQPWNELGELIDNEQVQQNIDSLNSYLSTSQAEEIDKLKWDFTRMFIGPMELEAPPWESTYYSDERLVFQESTLEVRRKFLQYNFLCKGYPNEADDHIGYELDFMYRLCNLELQAIEDNDWAKTKQILVDQKVFLVEHLNRWVPLFAEKIVQSAKAPFYPAVANLLNSFLATDEAMIEELINALA